MKKSTGFLLATTMFFMGVTIGFLFAPIKKGVYVGNNSGNRNAGQGGKYFDEIYK
jgi:hypothetical protein